MRDAPIYASSDAATAPSPAPSFDWSTSSTTPYSPGSINIPHDGTQAFSNFYNNNDTMQLPSNISPALLSRQHSYSASASASHYDPTPVASAPAIASSWGLVNRSQSAPPPPKISRLIPGEGPIHGGIEVTVLGENFVRGESFFRNALEIITRSF